MDSAATPSFTPREMLQLLSEKRRVWLTPMIACGVLAALFALIRPRYWEASQALVVRQETAGATNTTPGKFADLYEMRTMQETILELAKSQQVVVATIESVKRERGESLGPPTAEDIEKFRGRLKMLPPDGGEFGKTEVFYFFMKDADRDRAMALVSELCRHLDLALRELRGKRAGSLILELEQQVALATKLHEEETQRLVKFEAEVGADLGELRMLHSASSGQSDLRQEAVQLETDARKFQAQVNEAEQLLALLHAAEKDPQQLVATPNSLLTSQPALRRLKDGLVDAQLATARIGGTRLANHPRVAAAIAAEQAIRADLHRELETAVKGAEVELALGKQRLETVSARIATLHERLGRLATRRAEYSNRVAAVDNSRISLDRARQNLSTAKAAEAAARSGSLVTRIDQPETGPNPAGPGRTMIAGAGAFGGLLLGLGFVFLGPVAGPLRPTTSGRSDGATSANFNGARTAQPAPEWWDSLPAKRPAPSATVRPPAERTTATPGAEPVAVPVTATVTVPVATTVASRSIEEPAPIATPAVDWPAEVVAAAPELPATPAAFELAAPVDRPFAVEQLTQSKQAEPEQPPPLEQPAFVELPTPSPEAQQPTWASPALPAPSPAPPVAQPTKAVVLPTAPTPLPAGTLPSFADAGGFGGMSLEEALRAARQSKP